MPTLARGWAPLRGVLVGREKYIDLPIAELYDLDRDPREQQNLAALARDRRPCCERAAGLQRRAAGPARRGDRGGA